MSRRSRRGAAVAVGLLLSMVAMAIALAATGNPAEKVRAGDSIVIAANEVIDHDLYLFASEVTINGVVHGDVVVAGSNVTIAGTIDGDVLAAAANLAVGGVIHGDARLAAAQLTISGQVDEDAAVLSSTLLLAAGGHVGEDLLFSATQATLEGNVVGGISGTATSYQRRGTVGGTENVTLATPPEQTATARTVDLALNALRQFIVVLLFGLGGLWLLPKGMRSAATMVRQRPLQSMGIGVLTFVGAIVAVIVIVLLAILLGVVFGRFNFDSLVAVEFGASFLAVSGILFGLIVLVAFIGDAIVGLALGRLISAPESGRWTEILRLVVGSASVVLLTSFPEVGSLAKLLVSLTALGAVTIVINEHRERPVVPMVMAPPPPDMPPSI